MHCRTFHQHNCNRDSHNYNKNCFLQKLLPAYVLQKLLTAQLKESESVIESVSYVVPTETATYIIDCRNFHFQKWCQSDILLVTIKKLSKSVSTKFKANSFSTLCITYGEIRQWIVSMNCAIS